MYFYLTIRLSSVNSDMVVLGLDCFEFGMYLDLDT